MNVDHYQEALDLLESARKEGNETIRSGFRQAAQAHATLALADAIESATRKLSDELGEAVQMVLRATQG